MKIYICLSRLSIKFSFMIIGIIAIAQNFAIGKDGKLPWHYSADLKFFKQTTVESRRRDGF